MLIPAKYVPSIIYVFIHVVSGICYMFILLRVTLMYHLYRRSFGRSGITSRRLCEIRFFFLYVNEYGLSKKKKKKEKADNINVK